MDNTTNTNEQHSQLLVLTLRKIAESKSISQQEIANRTGLQRSNISRMFSLKYSPNLSTFIAVARAIGVNFFFEDKESDTDLNLIFEQAMDELGRHPRNLPQN